MNKGLAGVLASMVVMGLGYNVGAQTGIKVEEAYQENCGVTNNPLLAVPYTRISADIDGDGNLESYVGNGAVVEDHSGKVPQLIFSHTGNKYDCVKLRLVDLDADGDLDLIYVSGSFVQMFTYGQGKMKPDQ